VFVAGFLPNVTFAVQLEDEAGLGAEEIRDVTRDRRLSAKLESCETTAAQVRPKPLLGRSHRSTEFACSLGPTLFLLHWSDPAPTPPTPLPRGERGANRPSPPTPLPRGERGANRPSPPTPLPRSGGEGERAVLRKRGRGTVNRPQERDQIGPVERAGD